MLEVLKIAVLMGVLLSTQNGSPSNVRGALNVKDTTGVRLLNACEPGPSKPQRDAYLRSIPAVHLDTNETDLRPVRSPPRMLAQDHTA
ncbi:hypothetical protein CPAR01_10217 [Colletotrichum paranaense]|uniref:Uncharacterized protein n=1 Tax=Colletotrichum paranaense TaxID=1914294 RepID=A0ABQ9SDJ6_9PEZI|nr:uncharacterized protein CPAR01_10217 [Colletotrichum paranaense]KAK1533509.1 hypothetical protein CPAR01_10217 [Colletotrichum paranaense]